ncbi:MAG: MFS transporter [Alphaproteobacteria bacterium]|nr:MFS transporter [Alphaproteobacteria bacterium]
MVKQVKHAHVFWQLVPVILTFFAMGFVDLTGIATNYVKADFALSDTVANLFTSMVFFWFLVASVPTGMLMNRIGRHKTVLLSLVITLLAVALPLIDYNLPLMVISFSLLGIGNTMMQTSINPLLSNIVSKQRLSSAITFGQFVKAVAAFSAPILAAWAALHFGNWRMLYAVFLAEGAVALISLYFDKIPEEKTESKITGFKESFVLLADKAVLLSFAAIVCHVGIDVGTNVTAPKIFIEKLGVSLTQAGLAISVYFLFRTFASLFGAYVLAKYSAKRFFMISVIILTAGLLGLLMFDDMRTLYVCMGLIGFGNANIFPVVFSQIMLANPRHKNEISGLMIMGICGGAIVPAVMGIASDVAGSQSGAVAIMAICAAYLLFMITKIKDKA